MTPSEPPRGDPSASALRAAPSAINGQQIEYLEEQYARWKADPASVDAAWQSFFTGFDLGFARSADRAVSQDPAASSAGMSAPLAGEIDPVAGRGAQSKVDSLIYNYRDLGHLAATLDPLGSERPFPEQLTLESFGLTDAHLHQRFDPGSLPLENPAPLVEIVNLLEQTFCRTIGVEFMHLPDRERRRWLGKRMEAVRNRPEWTVEQRQHILRRLIAADAFEHFFEKRYVGHKRFGLGGGESLIVILDQMLELCPALGIREFALGMAHRGRLNVLANILHKRFEQILTEFEDAWVDGFVEGGGDVKYHRGHSSDHITAGGHKVHLTLAPNPSHLAFVTAVVQGRCRAKQRLYGDTEGRSQVVPIIMHGDAAFAGQGVIAECFNMAGLDAYEVGGTVHIIINNQLGFTTNPSDLFSGRYCTDIAKTADAPIFHVNGDDPEACAWVARLALEYRQTFKSDVVIDMWCYRRNGHNESDEPSFTQPLMYQAIRAHTPVAKKYRAHLEQTGVITAADFERLHEDFQKELDEAQTRTREKPVDPSVIPFQAQWSGLVGEYRETTVETGVPRSTLEHIASKLGSVPAEITPHKTVAKLLKSRAELGGEAGVDWALGEALAFGSLLVEGHPIRLSGQDVERGTFSHRHAVIHCQKSGATWTPLNHLAAEQAKFCIHNSPLTESACVGYEYGYSLADPKMLIIWEAQFGDFANGAQVFIDQFVATAENKWQRASGLTLFLPHGYEGQGPEHSSARLERFLELCANGNMQVVSPTTAAQLFHLLRRQLKRNFRKPLVVMTPKSMLRNPRTASPVDAFVSGSFQRVLPDAVADPAAVTRLILCTGKISHELMERRDSIGARHVAITRVEQLHPFPDDLVSTELARFPKADVIWVQEEPRNMGAYSYMRSIFLDRFGRDLPFIGRADAASPAVGSPRMHAQQQERILATAVSDGPLKSGPVNGAGTVAESAAPSDSRGAARTPNRAAAAGKR